MGSIHTPDSLAYLFSSYFQIQTELLRAGAIFRCMYGAPTKQEQGEEKRKTEIFPFQTKSEVKLGGNFGTVTQKNHISTSKEEIIQTSKSPCRVFSQLCRGHSILVSAKA